jgi:predicted lipoprotein with Yx(FWY)xxD motif
MRAFIIFLAALAALKIWVQDRMYRDAAGDALLAAYKEKAMAACQSLPHTDPRGMPIAAGSVNWMRADSAEVLIGNPAIPVYVWQVDHAAWNARYKHAIVRLKMGDKLTKLTCDYDVIVQTATVGVS